MKLRWLLPLLLLIFAQVGRAQDYDQHARVLFGSTAGSIYGNDFLDLNTSVEIPLKRLEFDGGYTFTPLEHKISLGVGTAQLFKAGGIVWVRKNLGVNGSFLRSSYSVKTASKTGEDVTAGLTLRHTLVDYPARFTFDYVRQVNNHIIGGTEPNYLQGGEFNMQVRLGAAGPFVIRMVADVQVGRVLNQGDPVCDGTFGTPVTCPRSASTGGGGSGGVVFEFPRRHDLEDKLF